MVKEGLKLPAQVWTAKKKMWDRMRRILNDQAVERDSLLFVVPDDIVAWFHDAWDMAYALGIEYATDQLKETLENIYKEVDK